jgi:hypothetical protein
MNADDMVSLCFEFGWFYPRRAPSKAALGHTTSLSPIRMQESAANNGFLDRGKN